MNRDRKSLPQDTEQCHEMIAGLLTELGEKDRRLRELQHLVERLLRWRYGPKRERVDENRLFLFAARIVSADQHTPGAPPEAPREKPKRTPHGRERRLKESKFHWWQRKLKEGRQACALESPRRTKATKGAGQATFALVSEEQGELGSAGIELVLRAGRRVRIGKGVDEETLRTVVAVLEQDGC